MFAARAWLPPLVLALALGGCGGEPTGGGVRAADERPPVGAPEGLGTMVLVPAGASIMGYDEGKGFERPQHEVVLGAFWIDVYETTNFEYRRFVRATGHESPPTGSTATTRAGATSIR